MTPISINKTETDLFIASHPDSLADFLKTELANNKHIYCCFPLSQFCRDLNARQVRSISFQSAHTLYPPFQRPS
ncbi:conserved hypothetical protein [Vibrio crassostreae]|nr:conserved hypothetical protein [Vibrio crassostreae]